MQKDRGKATSSDPLPVKPPPDFNYPRAMEEITLDDVKSYLNADWNRVNVEAAASGRQREYVAVALCDAMRLLVMIHDTASGVHDDLDDERDDEEEALAASPDKSKCTVDNVLKVSDHIGEAAIEALAEIANAADALGIDIARAYPLCGGRAERKEESRGKAKAN